MYILNYKFITIILMYFIMNTFQMNLIPKEFKILRAQSCADTEDYPIKIENLLFKQSEINQYQIAGKIVIRENIIEPIGMIINSSRCTIDNQKCDDLPPISVSNICEIIENKGVLWSPFVQSITPPIKCPFIKGVYEIKNGSFDLSVISRLPIDGYRYNTFIKFYKINKNSDGLVNTNSLPQLYCFDSDVIIT